jgi:uncharacterized protein YbjT (DUF2867 family)
LNRVIIAGASGLIGKELLYQLLNNNEVKEVVALVRKPLTTQHSKLIQIQIDFEDLNSFSDEIYGDAFYCCLGSTIKKTPDLADYKKVDFDYPLALAQLASANEIAQFHIISALGADINSKLFYPRIKGEIEEELKKIKFKSTHIYQPSLLSGERSENRLLEKIAVFAMQFINPLLLGSLRKYRSIRVSTIAKAIINQTFKNIEGIHIYPSNIIEQLA